MGNDKQRGIGELFTEQAQHPFLFPGVQGIEGLLQENPLGTVEQQAHHAQELLLPPGQGVDPIVLLVELVDEVFKAHQTQRLLELFLAENPAGGWVADGVAQGAGGQIRARRHEKEAALAGEFDDAAAQGLIPAMARNSFAPV